MKAICQQLVQNYHGEIGVESQVNEGSKFWFYVRMKKANRAVEERFPVLDEEEKEFEVILIHQNCWMVKVFQEYFHEWGITSIRHFPAAPKNVEMKHFLSNINKKLVILFISEEESKEIKEWMEENSEDPKMKLVILTKSKKEFGNKNSILTLYEPIKKMKLYVLLKRLIEPPTKEREDSLKIHQTKKFKMENTISKQSHLILVAEDNLINQKVIVRQLEKLGFGCMIANNGFEVLKLLEDDPGQFCVILMDCQMPECSGFTCTKEIRKREKETGQHIPIVAMTANAMENCEKNCLQAGMDDYISKPVQLQTLESTLKKWISSTHHHQQHDHLEDDDKEEDDKEDDDMESIVEDEKMEIN